MKKIIFVVLYILFSLSLYAPKPLYAACTDVGDVDICTHKYGNGGCGVETALGCIPISDSQEFTLFALTWAFGVAGGIAFLFLAFGGFLYVTSAGDPKKVQHGKEILMAALTGILFLIFSMFILRLVGVQIFNIAALQ